MSEILTSACESTLRSEMYNRISNQLQLIRSGNTLAKRVVLVVPAQSTLQTETEGFESLKEDGFFDFLVMSGAKLRSEILKQTGEPNRIAINRLGRSMLLRKVSSDLSEKLSVFKKISGSDGFIDMAGDFIVQLKQNNYKADDLGPVINASSKDSLLSSKLSDMIQICREYEKLMEGKYVDSEDMLEYASMKTAESEYIKESIIWYWGFYSFTAREYEFINALNEHSAGFNIAILSGDEKYICGSLTSKKLSKILKCDIKKLPSDEIKSKTRIISCPSPYGQSCSIAADILKKKREGVEYSEMLVLTQDRDDMGESLKRVFEGLGIPVFMDEKRQMGHTAAAAFISSCLKICCFGFRRQDILEILKSGLLPFDHNDVELFENYICQYKIFEKSFAFPFVYGKKKIDAADFSRIDDIRETLYNFLFEFSVAFNNACTVKEKTEKLYGFLADEVKLPEALEEFSNKLENQAYIDESSENKQSWDYVVSLMDQMVELIGEEKISAEDYAALFDSSLADIQIGVLPQSEGKIRIGTISRSSFGKLKALYIAGVNEGIVPSEFSCYGILTEKETENLHALGFDLSKNSRMRQLEEMFQVERALDTKCDELVLTFCASDSNGDTLRPSSLLDSYTEENAFFETDALSGDSIFDYVQSREFGLEAMPEALKAYVLGYELSDDWKAVYNELREERISELAAEAVFFTPQEGNLVKGKADELFSKENGDYFSPTQLEQYSSCPFKHFINHGLRPDELREFDLGSREIGSVYHEVLLEISERLSMPSKEKGIKITDPDSLWMTIDDEGLMAMVKEVIKQKQDSMMEGLLTSDVPSRYRTGRIEKVCFSFSKYMVLQVRKGRVSSMMFETGFGRNRMLPPIEIMTESGKVFIEGQIDRVDILSAAENDYVKIIDYKSGTKTFDIGKIEAGLDLQLMIYLEAALGSDKTLKPAGVFYFAIKDPSKDVDMAELVAEQISKELEKKISSEYSLDGIVLNDADVLSAMDMEILNAEKVDTDVFRVKARSSQPALMSALEIEKLRRDLSDRLSAICGKIKEGSIRISPAYYKKENVACRLCDYSGICLRSIKY